MTAPNWANRTMFIGDNLDVLRGMNSASVDLVYADPPFNSRREYSAPVGSKAAGAAFSDYWTWDDVDAAWLGELADGNPAAALAVEAAGACAGRGMKSYVLMMAIRLVELRRVLKPDGAIYLHCDDTAGAYLRLVMDAVYGTGAYRNEIIWKRTSTVKRAKGRYPRDADRMLFYAAGHFEPQYRPLADGGLRAYSHRDDRGRYQLVSVGAAAPTGGYRYDLGLGEIEPKSGYRMPEKTARQWLAEGRLVVRAGKVPRQKRHLADSKGAQVSSTWTDIGNLQGKAKEKLDFPTQKPLALLRRVIEASSNPGDVVLDPFAGCATTCVAAEELGRQWAGIDLSALAAKLVVERLRDAGADHFGSVTVREDVPRRTDREAPPPARKRKHELYGAQEGHCTGCGVHFPFRNLTIDHVLPKAKGGTDHIENLQLLCQACNSTKGTRDMAYLTAALAARAK